MRARAIGDTFFWDLHKDNQRRLLQVGQSQNKKKSLLHNLKNNSKKLLYFNLQNYCIDKF